MFDKTASVLPHTCDALTQEIVSSLVQLMPSFLFLWGLSLHPYRRKRQVMAGNIPL